MTMITWRTIHANAPLSIPQSQSVGTAHAPAVHHATGFYRWRVVVALVLALVLAGCTSSQMKQFEQGQVSGTFNGHPVQVSWKRNTTGEVVVDLNVPPALIGAANVATGGLLGQAGDIAGLLMAILGAGYGMQQRGGRLRAEREADIHRADSDQGWAKYEAAMKDKT